MTTPPPWPRRPLETWSFIVSTVLLGSFLEKSSDTRKNFVKIQKMPRGCTEIFWFLMPCNSGTARWKNFVLVLYCRAIQELLNGTWIMGIHPGEPKRTTFCARHFLWALASSMHKSGCRGAHECLRVIGLERAESRRVALSSGLCLES